MPLAPPPRQLGGGGATSSTAGMTPPPPPETGTVSAQAVDRLMQNLRLGPSPLRVADEVEGEEGVEDEADAEEACSAIGAGFLAGGSNVLVRSSLSNFGVTGDVVDLRDTGVVRMNGVLPARSSTGTTSVAGGSRRGGYPSRGTAGTAAGAGGSSRPGPALSEPPPIDLEQVLQALLLHQGLLEDHEVLAQSELGETSGSRPRTGAATPSWRTLREMRRVGPLGELSEDAQTTLLGGTLYAYGGEEMNEPSSLHISGNIPVIRVGTSSSSRAGTGGRWHRPATPAASGGGLYTESLGTSYDSVEEASAASHAQAASAPSHPEESHVEEAAESLSQAGTAPTFANLLQLSLDRILHQSHREAAAAGGGGGLRSTSRSATGGAADLSLMNTARSIRTVLGPLSPNSEISMAEELAESLGPRPVLLSQEVSEEEMRVQALEEAIEDASVSSPSAFSPEARPFGVVLSRGFTSSEAVTSNLSVDDEQDEGVVSVVGFDSPRSLDSPATSRAPHLRGHLRAPPPAERDLLDETSSVWGLGDTVRSSTSTVRSDSIQHSARTIEAGLEGFTGMFARLASENLLLDESVTRSVRRVLQLGTVLTGQRLSEEEIRALPQVCFDAAEQQNCTICLEAYRRGEFLTSLRCGHFFHVDCLARWFQRATQCPLCRSECVD
mmetsp:Transcript_34312/g.94796  ORF Transcript_34312/g.94796 Transcript_34312/m.94796 type:complete len:668 (-) Transcript_34312:191-2194(-)